MREQSIDVLRGIAIVGMVLSGTISRSPDLPGWLFHAQIPPPDFKFNPALPGITWVDLVFPFFIFAMGAAIPYSLCRLAETANGIILFKKIAVRAFRLFVFAVMLGHLSPWHYNGAQGLYPYLFAALAFAAFFLAFTRLPSGFKHSYIYELSGYAIILGLLLIRHFVFNLPFSANKNDIIILVLANLAVFGGFLWYFTRNKPLMRLAILTLFVALRFTNQVDESVNQWLWSLTPGKLLVQFIPGLYNWMLPVVDFTRTVFYNPEFLKYLMILVPGTFAGEILKSNPSYKPLNALITGALVIVIVLNVWALYNRVIWIIWVVNLLAGIGIFFRKSKSQMIRSADLQIVSWSWFWLILGIVFEASEGGIKKDPSTISYLLITAGLAGFFLVVLRKCAEVKLLEKLTKPFEKAGMNPMVGYVIVSYLIIPLLYFVGLLGWIDGWYHSNPWLGLLRGIVLTAMMLLALQWFHKTKLFWKT